MAVLFVIVFVLAVFHLVYEAVIAASERNYLKHKLSALRDEVIFMKINEEDDNEEIFNQLESTVKSAIQLLPYLGLVQITKMAIKSKNNMPELRRNAEKRHRIYASHSIRVKEINEEISRCVRRGFLVNMGGWLPYISIALLFILIPSLCKKAHKWLKLQVDRIIVSTSPSQVGLRSKTLEFS